MKLDDLVRRVEELIEKGNQVLKTTYKLEKVAGKWVDSQKFADFRTSCLCFLSRTYGENSPIYLEFDKHSRSDRAEDVERGLGILMASKEELQGGWLTTTKGLLSAEISVPKEVSARAR